MITVGTPLSTSATKALLCGSGELGKEIAIELQRFGIEVIAVDRYPNAPAMQIAHRSHVIDMLDPLKLSEVIEAEKPHIIIPEIEALATQTLLELEQKGYKVAPTANATHMTMNREHIRRLASEQLQIPTSNYQFASNLSELKKCVTAIGLPCVVKPIMSSSGKGQSLLKQQKDIETVWNTAICEGRAKETKVIVEAFVPFDYEITLLTVRHSQGLSFCAPIGHTQKDGDYRESWQPHPMSTECLEQAEQIADKITAALGGFGLFGVEFFIKDDSVIFSEVSPRPHDTGLVTMISQNLSEFSLHVRAILGLPIPHITQYGPAASHALLVEGNSDHLCFQNLDHALAAPNTNVLLFGKPTVQGKRRMGVTLALGNSIDEARQLAAQCATMITTA